MCSYHTVWQMKNITDDEYGNLSSTACPLLSTPLDTLFLLCHVYFQKLPSLFIHYFLCGWRLVGAHVSYAWCVYVCAHASTPVYFQSILFKDQTRGWWLIFLSPAFFHLLRKGGRGGEEKEEGSAFCTAQEYPPPLPDPPPSCPSEV